MAATPAAPAHASANGQSFWGGNIPFAGRFIPSGTLTILVHGKGLNIDYMYSNWYGHLCNSRIDWRIYYKGATWWYSKGPVDKGCSVHGYRYRGTGAGPDGSKLCAQVVDDPTGNRYTSACITIKK